MRGGLRQVGPGTWELRVSLPKDATGRYREVTRRIHGTKREAQMALAAFLVEQRGAQAVRRPTERPTTLPALIGEWLDHVAPNRSPTTIAEYRRLTRQRIAPALDNVKLDRLTARHLDTLYGQLQREGLSPGSIRQVHAICRRALAQGVRWEYLERNVADAATPPPVRAKRHNPPDPAGVAKLILSTAELDPDLACLFRVAAATGARRGEVLGLQWPDVEAARVHLRRNVVTIAGALTVKDDLKTWRSRTVSIDPGTAAVLAEHRARVEARAGLCGVELGPWVFTRQEDGSIPMHPDAVSRAFARARGRVGLPKWIRLHDLRHFMATELLAAGHDVVTVAARLGHGSAKTTLDVYAHVVKGGDEGAAGTMGRLLDGDP